MAQKKSKYNLQQLISQPTALEGTTIDLVFTNIPSVQINLYFYIWNICKEKVINTSLSKHRSKQQVITPHIDNLHEEMIFNRK